MTDDIRYFFATLTILPGVLFREWLLLNVCREKTKTIAFGNNIIAFVTSTMREKVMGRQNVFF